MTDKPWSKRAHQCYRCPKDGAADGTRGCPRWWKTVQVSVTGETKVWEECGDVHWPVYATEIIKASNRPAAAIESTRNEMVRGLAAIAVATREFSSHAQLPSVAPVNGITYEEKK